MEEISHFIEKQWLFGSFCPPPAPHFVPLLGQSIPKFSRTLNITNRHVEATSWEMSEVKCHEEQRSRVPSEWVDKCYMSASCLKTRRMISLSSGPTEITAGRRAARLSKQTPARGARGTTESCNLESNQLSMTSVSLSGRRRRDGWRQEMLMLGLKLLRLRKWFQQLRGRSKMEK